MENLHGFLVSLVLLVTSGCTAMPAPISSTAQVDTTKGVLLAAISSDGNSQVRDTWFFYRQKGTSKEHRLDAFGLAGLLKKPNDFEGQEAVMGRLIALPLEPGQYELFNWTLYVTRFGGYGYISPKIPPPPHAFTIRAGEITYLGGLHVETVLGKNLIGMSLPFGGNPNITDQFTRDLPILKRKYPNLADWSVQSSIPDNRQWRLSQ